MVSLQPKYLRRYKDLARLLYKYGRGDLVSGSGIDVGTEMQVDGNATPDDLAQDLESLGPAYIKLGQLLSTRGELLPPAYIEALERLQDKNEPIEWAAIHEVLTEQYGFRPEKIFASIEHDPMATASLGQVHRATLQDGREVVVKVLRPDLQPDLDDDLHAFEELASLLHATTDFGGQYQLVNLVETLKTSILSELDYRKEASNAAQLKRNLKEFDGLLVPEPVLDLCRPKVLVIQRVSGTKITKLSPVVLLELDGKAMADEIFEAYLHQVLIDGHFHADPHPGNLWLTQDHKIALLDFGLVVHVSPLMRSQLLKLLIAVGEADAETATKLAIETGQQTDRFDDEKLQRLIDEVFTNAHGSGLDQMNAGQIIMQIQDAAFQSGVILPIEVTMLGKTLLNLDKVVKLLDKSFNPTEAIRTHADAMVQKHGADRLSLSTAYQSLLESADLMQNLPARANEITRRVADSDFRVAVDAFDEDNLMTGLQKIANRITAGLIIAALIVAASRLMALQTSWTIMGYPGLALIFFLISVILGGIVLKQILFSDKNVH